MQRDLGQRMSVCRDGIARIERMLQESPGNWQEYLNYARSIIASLDQVNSIPPSIARSEQAWAVTTLQKLAFQDADTGGVPWLSDWCQRQWLRMIEWDQSDVDSLRGLGHYWLLKAQKQLAAIHREDGSTSSGTSSARTGDGRAMDGLGLGTSHSYSQCDDDAAAARAAVEAELRLHTPNYVEARALLVPATDLLKAAVGSAEERGVVSGDLLCLAAEAYMSLGNVSLPRVAEEHFTQAVRYLRQAQDVAGYVLAPYLQHYLDEYGRLVD